MLGKNRLKEKLRGGELCIGAMLSFPSPPLAEMLARSGSDAVIFETEHSCIDLSQIEELSRACEVADVATLCRVPALKPDIISRAMDAGVMGVIVPHVKTANDAQAIVSCVKYPPIGERGFGTIRASGYGALSVRDYVVKANDETMIIVMIEDLEAVHNIDEILKVGNIDCIFLGRGDLSLSMGYPGQADAPEVLDAVESVVSKTVEAGVTLMVATSVRETQTWIQRGARFLSIQTAALFRSTWLQTVEGIRAQT